MSVITDEMSQKSIQQAPKALEKTLEGTGKAISKTKQAGGLVLKGTVKGICLIIKGSCFTTDAVMKSITGNIKYSHQNISISKLMKSGTVRAIDENITADVMQYFDKHCKKFHVKYTAMKDTRDPNNPVYMVFYEGKQMEVIKKVIQEASKDYMKAQKESAEKQEGKGKEKENGEKPKRESVKAKLAFFRNRVGAVRKDKVRNKDQEQQKENHDRAAR